MKRESFTGLVLMVLGAPGGLGSRHGGTGAGLTIEWATVVCGTAQKTGLPIPMAPSISMKVEPMHRCESLATCVICLLETMPMEFALTETPTAIGATPLSQLSTHSACLKDV